MIPPKDQLTICFAHAAYQMKACFDALDTGIKNFELREREEFDHRAPEADVIVVSGMWHNGLIGLASKLRFVQSIGSGTDQFDKEQLAVRGIRLASAAGVNARAVAEHAMALILAMVRRLPEARDNQARRFWRVPDLVSDVCLVHDPADPHQRRIRQLVPGQDAFERAATFPVAELGAAHVKRGRLSGYLVGIVDEHELGVLIDEAADQPRAGGAVDVHVSSGRPDHAAVSSAIL
jgi:lactate dehydrogenase-like 2-hydroxyacid dehydrogenase